jgi:hypothetical protein
MPSETLWTSGDTFWESDDMSWYALTPRRFSWIDDLIPN